jgi:endoglucanase
MQRRQVGVHIGEWGVFQYTPHDAALGWMSDQLQLWREADWGWALWQLRGGFGVLDSNRTDVKYEQFRGHLLDRQMLELLRAG